MFNYRKLRQVFLLVQLLFLSLTLFAQHGETRVWLKSGNAYVINDEGSLMKHTLPNNQATALISQEALRPEGEEHPLLVSSFTFSEDEQKVLLFTNTEKVWRYNTRGDYWLYDLKQGKLKQLGQSRPASSLMFAKISPDGSKAAYVSEYNLYVEDLASGRITQLTQDGHRKLINGTFDWAYEEEFQCRDGFRWSPDSKKIAYWQLDASQVKDYVMFNLTDDVYSKVLPVEYPVVGESPSPYKIGVVDINTAATQWMNIPGDPSQHYVPRMEWAASAAEIIVQQLNRKQNESKLMLCNASSGEAKTIFQENDAAWIDVISVWDMAYSNGGWEWIKGGKEFIWMSEKGGWRQLYRISRDGKNQTLITPGAYDVMDIVGIDEKGGWAYYMASPTDATQKYLYRSRLDDKGKLERLSPETQPGTHSYELSPNAKWAFHEFSNHYTKPADEWITLPQHKPIMGKSPVEEALAKANKGSSGTEFFTITTDEGVEMDAWMVKPKNFDPNKKYPVVFYVYTEPWAQTVQDVWGIGHNFMYQGDMAADGYIYVSIDNRGTPAPKGREWRKSIYRQIGRLNIKDQAMAAKKLLEQPFIDKDRVAVWGWSGGGAATLNMLFQYPDIYKTGIAIASITNQLTYDNIYQERYMGLPQENMEDFVQGSPVTHAKHLKGNLLFIHGTADDNVHYNNAELLINELVKHNKQFQVMPYPNRSHSMAEGEGTYQHLFTLYTNYLKQHCPPGGKAKEKL